MTIPLESYNAMADVFGQPQCYKGIYFYPIKLKDKLTSGLYDSILNLSRSQMYDMNGIEVLEREIKLPWIMVYLTEFQKYLDVGGFGCMLNLKLLFQHICKIDDPKDIKIGFAERDYLYNCNTCADKEFILEFRKTREENGIEKDVFIQFDAYDFNEIRSLILCQNGTDVRYVDAWNKSLEKYQRDNIDLEMKKNKTSGDELFANSIVTYKELSHSSYEEISEMTLYQFNKGNEKAVQINDYAITLPILVKTGKKIDLQHYTSIIKQGKRYFSGNAFQSMDDADGVVNKINTINN